MQKNAFSVVNSRPSLESLGGIIHRGKAVDCDLVVKPMGKTFFQTRPDQYLHITWKDELFVVSVYCLVDTGVYISNVSIFIFVRL